MLPEAADAGWEVPPLPEVGPRVWVMLPDQQEVSGMLLAQLQGNTGSWLCLVSVSIWEHAQVEGRDQAQATCVHITVPASHIERVEGERYEHIVTRRHPSPRPEAVEDWWYVQRMRAGDLRYVHHARCWCPGPREQQLDAEQARQELLSPGAVPCSACDPEKDL